MIQQTYSIKGKSKMKNCEKDLFETLKNMFGSVDEMKEDQKNLKDYEKKTTAEILKLKESFFIESKNIYLERESVTHEVIRNIKSVKSQIEFLIKGETVSQENLNKLNNSLSVQKFKGITKIKELDKKYSLNIKSFEMLDFVLHNRDIVKSKEIDSLQFEYNKVVNESMAIIHYLPKINID